MEDTAQMWTDSEVEFGERPAPNKNWDGFLKADGTPVRRCDGGHWKLLEEFPPKSAHFATWYCYWCHNMPKPPAKKSNKGEKFSRYNEYVLECQRIQEQLLIIRNEYMQKKEALMAEKRELNRNYRENRR